MITDIRKALKTLGYVVHSSRQEKIGTNEIVVILDDVTIEIETTATYRARNWILLEWDTANPDEIPSKIVKLVKSLEEYIVETAKPAGMTSFKFLQSEVNMLGLMYRVSIILEYVEEIRLD